jgi:hypothetical protein
MSKGGRSFRELFSYFCLQHSLFDIQYSNAIADCEDACHARQNQQHGSARLGNGDG